MASSGDTILIMDDSTYAENLRIEGKT